MRRFILIAVSAWSCFASAGLMDLVRKQYCNEDGSFAKGMNDARKGQDMSFSFVSACRDDDHDKFRKSYKEGYLAGMKNKKGDDSSGGLTINIGNGGGGSPRAHHCTLEPFTTTFEGFGATVGEAKREAKAKCMAKHVDFHCTDFKCDAED